MMGVVFGQLADRFGSRLLIVVSLLLAAPAVFGLTVSRRRDQLRAGAGGGRVQRRLAQPDRGDGAEADAGWTKGWLRARRSASSSAWARLACW